MKVDFDKSFAKSVDKLKNKRIKNKIIEFIETLEIANSLQDVSSIKKLKGDKISYRKKIGDYRIGFEYDNDVVTLIVVAHRKDIYKNFP